MSPIRIILTVLALVVGGFASFFLLAALAGKGFYGLHLGSTDGMAQMRGGGRQGEGLGGMHQDPMNTEVPGLRPEQLPDPDSIGAGLMVRYCTQCHNLPSPKTHSAGEWEGVVDRMDRHMEMMEGRGRREMKRITRLIPDERTEILAYLRSHALLPFSAEGLPESDSPEAQLFSKFCIQCHVLPAVNLHTENEWPAVVERMRMNMRVLGKPVITDAERDGIVQFLQKASKN